MRLNNRFILVLATAVSVAMSTSSCTSDRNEVELDYEAVELLMLEKIIEAFYPNTYYQDQDDGFYVQPIDMSAKEGTPTNGGDGYWIRYNIMSQTLDGDITNTRNAIMAKQLGSFNYKTRYTPAIQFITLDEDTTIDVIDYMCQSTDIVIDGEITNVYAGNSFNLFAPSGLQGYLANGSGGYAGQTTMSTSETMICEIEITEVMDNIVNAEKASVDQFMADNMDGDNEWVIVSKFKEYEEDEEDYFEYDYEDDGFYDDDDYEDDYGIDDHDDDPDEEDHCIYVWVNQGYTPSTKYNFTNPYPYQYLPDNYENAEGFDYLESLVVAALEGLELDEDENYADGTFELSTDEDDDIIDPETSAKIWYIARTLDGFIIDTNIEEVEDIVFGTESGGSAISYNPSYSGYSYIDAWYFGLIELRYGQWASILTMSPYAYGIYGQTGSSSSTEIQPYTPLLFNVFIQKNE
ncbi:MAG: hypothetical protein SNG45_09110 [Rikenellaceae bacterium]